MAKNLLIVESPAKAKTIEKFLGKDFKVKSSYGHIRDLEKGNKAIKVDNNFEPTYIVTPDKVRVVKDLREWVGKVDDIWLATDEDREGEAISWHLCEVLGLDPTHTKRIVFREITKPAIQQAIQNPRTIDANLVNAQQARRVLDRLVGFELSEILWRKIKGKLSAGRVQSVAVKLIVEREREIQSFEAQSFYKIGAMLRAQGKQSAPFKAELPRQLEAVDQARTYLQKCIGATFTVKKIEVKPLTRKPAPPFTTSTLQQEASRKLGFSVQRTMINAQKLYEAGHITYMRTDSTSLSQLAIASIAAEVEKLYGKEYVHTRQYKSRKLNTQEAHEAIRPTYISHQTVSMDRDEQRLYELIWKRTLASQMAEAKLEKTIVTIGVSTIPDGDLQADGEVLKFEGFLKVYLESTDEEDEENHDMLPPLSKGQQLDLIQMNGTERFTRPPARYTEAGLVKKLEELGIGRPSTYAPTISKIMEEGRGYVIKETRPGNPRSFQELTLKDGRIREEQQVEMTGGIKNQLVPTDMGMIVCDFLDANFQDIMNYHFTAGIEKQFDEIASGEEEWHHMVRSFYEPFHETVEKTMNEKGRAAETERELGKDPETGLSVVARMTRYGPVIQLGKAEELPEGVKPRYANLTKDQSLTTIELGEALGLFGLPKDLGEYRGVPVSVGVGRFGPYVKYGDSYVSLPKGSDPHQVDLAAAKDLILAKEAADAPIGTHKGLPVTKGKGRFGPFIKWDGLYINVPRRIPFETISIDDCHELIEAKVKKEANRYIHRWEEEKICIENGRFGPFIRFGKKLLNLPRVEGKKMSAEEAEALTLEQVKSLIEQEWPDAFTRKKSRTGKEPSASTGKAPAKKGATEKKTVVASKSAATKKTTAAKSKKAGSTTAGKKSASTSRKTADAKKKG